MAAYNESITGGRMLMAAIAMALAAALSGCGGDGSSGRGGSTAAPPTTASQTIGPAGGTVTSGDGRLTLTFPPGALPAANTITIETRDPASTPSAFQGLAAEAYYDLQPDGLQFDQPVMATFNLGRDPVADDGTISYLLSLLLTEDNGAPAVLDELTIDTDPATGLSRISGEINHFSPLVFFSDKIHTLLVIAGVPPSLQTDKTFTARVIVAVDFDATPFDAVGDITHTDSSSDPLTEPQPLTQPIPRTGPAFSGDIQYGCTAPGTGKYAALITLEGVEFDFQTGQKQTIQLGLLTPVRSVTCIAPDNSGGGEETALIVPLPGQGGPPAAVPYPFNIFDVSVPVGAEPPEFLATVYSDGSLRAYDENLALRDSIFLGGDFAFASAAISYDFMDSGGAMQHRDGIILGGADGAVFVSRTTDGAFNITQTLERNGNVTDVVAFNGGRNAATVNFSQAEVHFFGPGAANVFERKAVSSTLINLEAVDNNAPVSVWVPDSGFDNPGDRVLVATNFNVATRQTNGKLFECVRTGDDSNPGADCAEMADFGAGSNTLRVRAAPPDAEGDTVVAVSNFGSQTVGLFRWNVFGGGMTRIDPIEDAQTVTPAVTRSGDEVTVVATDTDEDMLVAAKLMPGDTTATVQRAPTPEQPPANNPSGMPIKASNPSHVAPTSPIVELLGRFVFTSEGRAPDAGTLLLGSLLALGLETPGSD